MARFVSALAIATFSVSSMADPSGSLLRGAGRRSDGDDAAATAGAEGGVNVTAQWGIWWGSCYDYGCHNYYQIGHLCGCWPGCVRLSLCCSDYYQACPAPTPAPTHRPLPAPAPAPTHAPSPLPAPVPWMPAPSPTPSPGPSDGEVYKFYIYRAQSTASYPPKNVNAANLVGAMWYLQHEVVIETPPKFGITRILRYTVETKAPSALLAAGMDFGVRYAYDSQKCTGPGDCSTMYAKYGYFVGCNNFDSNYPFPKGETHYAGGVWYSFPGEGACDGTPTGAADCTYSYSWPPEEISLDELTDGDSATFWADENDDQANAKKVQAAAALFKKKYPDSEALAEPQCNFDFTKFWN